MLKAIPALSDNYIWCWQLPDQTWAVVDPGDGKPVIANIKQEISHILLTHHHQDHTAGIEELLAKYPKARVFGPQNSSKHLSVTLVAGDEILGLKVIDTPGHTLDHIIYVNDSIALLGDHVFKYGCGRVFEGDLNMMYYSLAKVKALPSNIICYPAHEYTLTNLLFTKQYRSFIGIDSVIQNCKGITLPMQLSEQLLNNPFLACTDFKEFEYLRHLRNDFI